MTTTLLAATEVRFTSRNVLSAISTVIASVCTPLIVGPCRGNGINAGSVISPAAVVKLVPGGPGIRTVTDPAPFGMVTAWAAGRPEPICRKSRTIRSMPARTELFMLAICRMVSLPLITSERPASVAPMITVKMPIEISSSTSEYPAAEAKRTAEVGRMACVSLTSRTKRR